MLEILSLLSPGAVAMLFAFLVSRCQRGRESRDLCCCCRVASVSLWFVVSLPSCVFSLVVCFVWFCACETQFQFIWCETYATLSIIIYVHQVLWYLVSCMLIRLYILLTRTILLLSHVYLLLILQDYKIQGSVDPNVCALHSKGTTNQVHTFRGSPSVGP